MSEFKVYDCGIMESAEASGLIHLTEGSAKAEAAELSEKGGYRSKERYAIWQSVNGGEFHPILDYPTKLPDISKL
jgi:hypothetical protein